MVRTFILSFIFISAIMYYANQPGSENAQTRVDDSRVLTHLQLKKEELLKDGKLSKAKLASFAFRTNIADLKRKKVQPTFKFLMELPKPNPQRNPPRSIVELVDDLVQPAPQKVVKKKVVKPKGLMQIVSRSENPLAIQVADLPKLEPDHWGRNELLRYYNRNTTQAFDRAYFHPTSQPNYSPSNASNVDVNDLYKTGVVYKGRRYRVVGLGRRHMTRQQSRVDRRQRWLKQRSYRSKRVRRNANRALRIRLSSVEPRHIIQKKSRSEVKISKVRKKRRSAPKANKYSRRFNKNKKRAIDRRKKKRYVRQLPRKSRKSRKRRAPRTKVVQKRVRKRVRRSKFKPVREGVFGGLQF